MTPRPPTHREPTDEEMQCLPEGSFTFFGSGWELSSLTGTEIDLILKPLYAVPNDAMLAARKNQPEKV